jgi:hypothetical protein
MQLQSITYLVLLELDVMMWELSRQETLTKPHHVETIQTDSTFVMNVGL